MVSRPAKWGKNDNCIKMNEDKSGYTVRITRRGPSSDRFGWSIWGPEDSLEIKRSTMAFETRMEAIADSVQAAMPLAFPLIV